MIKLLRKKFNRLTTRLSREIKYLLNSLEKLLMLKQNFITYRLSNDFLKEENDSRKERETLMFYLLTLETNAWEESI